MEKTDRIDKFAIKRVSAFKDELLLIFFCILLFIALDNYLIISKVNPLNFHDLIIYILLFMALACLYFPKKITKLQVGIFLITALVFRLLTLFTLPVITHDLHRDLLFGSLFANGWNPYLWISRNVPILLQKGLILKVSYISDWPAHSFDYPSLAVFFFGIISLLSPADNFSAFVIAKFVLMIVDLLNAFLIYRILAVHFNLVDISKKTALLYLLNPVSMIWVNIEGQFDTVPLFFVLLSFYLLFYLPSGTSFNNDEKSNLSKKKHFIKLEYFPYLIGFIIACGFLFKFYPIVFSVAIIFYFGKNLKAIFNFLFSLFVTISALSFPFLVNSYYITNFLLFQVERPSKSVSHVNVTIGLLVSFILTSGFLISFVLFLVFRNRYDKKLQTSFLGLFSVNLFIYLDNSYHYWYAIWIFGTLLFINTSHDEFIRSLLWIVSSVTLIFIWGPSYFIIVVSIAVVSYFVTLERYRTFVLEKIRKIIKYKDTKGNFVKIPKEKDNKIVRFKEYG